MNARATKPFVRIFSATVVAVFTLPFLAAWIAAYDGARVSACDTVALDPSHPRHDGGRWIVVDQLGDGLLRVKPEAGGEPVVLRDGEFAVMDHWKQ